MKHVALLTFVQYSRAEVEIEAETIEQAEQMAGEISADEVENWNPTDGMVSVESVRPV